ncbi:MULTISPECIES: SRPBCC domain-containing protein [unclassified Streptomyces]|uniref:SRPBCC domain-containing protein n=1 Tax=unclassified Streptomyces TaxID=2593676 RepID=UPI00225AF79D|nr:SRPBCC domain-containing protein [Streptomyces sp. NBC_00620]MCX4972347.1 SRPBCC family protein [Streptomyces sp. NBC_00620]WTB39174.1 SRPBCC family protein [Streptomyces sp. NBC_00827]
MTRSIPSIEEGATETREDTRTLHYLLRLPQPVDKVWAAVATPEGLRGWLAAVEVFEPRLGGAVALHGLGSGRITAWDVERVAEYTVEGRVRFHLEPGVPDGTTVRFTHAYEGERKPPGWRARFERLLEALTAS